MKIKSIGAFMAICLVWLSSCTIPVDPTPAEPATQPKPQSSASSILEFPVETPTAIPVAPERSFEGGLILIDQNTYPHHGIVHYDLQNQVFKTLFDAPKDGWVHQLDLNKTGDRFLVSYAQPPDSRIDPAWQPYDRSGIYLIEMEADGLLGEPQLLVGNTAPNEFFFNPVWSADEKSFFYVGYNFLPSQDQSKQNLDVSLYHFDIEARESKLVSQDGIWPRVSPNGEWLLYIQVDPQSSDRGIRLLNLETKEVREVVEIGAFFDIDTPIFSADGMTIYFGAVPHSTGVEQPRWQQFLGAKQASAHTDHNIPSDWWSVSINGGEPTKVTSNPQIMSHGDLSGPNNRIFYATFNGMYSADLMNGTVERIPINMPSRVVYWSPY